MFFMLKFNNVCNFSNERVVIYFLPTDNRSFMGKKILLLSILSMLPLLSFFGCTTDSRGREDGMGLYTLPGEDSPHEGTWLSWPHHHTYGKKYRDEIEPVWVAMTDALTEGERAHSWPARVPSSVPTAIRK